MTDPSLIAAVKDFIKPELLVLVAVLYILGMILKSSEAVKDKWIPLWIGVVGIVFAILYVMATSPFGGPQDIAMSIFVGLTQGILCAGAALWINQVLVVQPKKDKEPEEDKKE